MSSPMPPPTGRPVTGEAPRDPAAEGKRRERLRRERRDRVSGWMGVLSSVIAVLSLAVACLSLVSALDAARAAQETVDVARAAQFDADVDDCLTAVTVTETSVTRMIAIWTADVDSEEELAAFALARDPLMESEVLATVNLWEAACYSPALIDVDSDFADGLAARNDDLTTALFLSNALDLDVSTYDKNDCAFRASLVELEVVDAVRSFLSALRDDEADGFSYEWEETRCRSD